jgi:predicted phosphodiesterase
LKIILTADWHLRKNRPRCRLDEDWVATQKDKLMQIKDLARKHNAVIWNAGDTFHTPIVPPVIEQFMLMFTDVRVLTGNHDLEHHADGNLEKSSLGVVLHFPNVSKLETERPIILDNGEKILCLHTLVFPDKASQPQLGENTPGVTAEELLDLHPGYDWILTGDYHRNFHYEVAGRHVINPGCLTRQAADFVDYHPGVYVIDFNTHDVEFVYLKINKNVLTESYLKKEAERENRMDAFIETVRKKKGVSVDFLSNLKQHRPNIKGDTLAVFDEIYNEIEQG